MSKLKIFMHPLSQPARAVVLFARANNIPHEEVFVDLAKGEQLGDAYSKNVNPLKKVPVINHDGFFLTESVAILRYLARTFSAPDHWYPSESIAQSRVDEYLEWQHLNTRIYGTMYFVERYMLPMRTKQPINEKRADSFLKGYKTCLDQIENIWLKDRPFVAGQSLSIADLLAASEIEQTALAGYDVKDHHAKIKEYLDRVSAEVTPHYNDVFGLLHKLSKRSKESSQAKE